MSFSITQIKYPLQYFDRPVNAFTRMGALFLSLLFASLSLACICFIFVGITEPLPDSLLYILASITMCIAFGYSSRLFYNYTFSGAHFNPQFRAMTEEYRLGFMKFPR